MSSSGFYLLWFIPAWSCILLFPKLSCRVISLSYLKWERHNSIVFLISKFVIGVKKIWVFPDWWFLSDIFLATVSESLTSILLFRTVWYIMMCSFHQRSSFIFIPAPFSSSLLQRISKKQHLFDVLCNLKEWMLMDEVCSC